jgi:hypothetical protein
MTIDEMISERVQSILESVTLLEDLSPKFKRLDALMKNIGPFIEYRNMIIGNQLLVCVKVKRMVDIQPVIEYLQNQLSIEFDKTSDYAEGGWRSFTSKDAEWLRVDAELTGDGPECRRVIVGYDTVPKYEIKSGDDAAAPDAPKPTGEF